MLAIYGSSGETAGERVAVFYFGTMVVAPGRDFHVVKMNGLVPLDKRKLVCCPRSSFTNVVPAVARVLSPISPPVLANAPRGAGAPSEVPAREKTKNFWDTTLASTIVALFVLFVPSVITAGMPAFSNYFTGELLRIDVIHSGTQGEEEIAVRALKKESAWPGPTGTLVPPWDMGQYRVDLHERKSKKLIFRKGFSTLFSEWQTTGEARELRRAFEETLEVPFPRDSVELKVYSRTREGEFRELFSMAIDPGSHLIEKVGSFEGAEVFELFISGEPGRKVDVLVLGDGYTRAEKGKFERDCERFAENFFSVEPFASYKTGFNLRALFIPSPESGVDEPRKGIYKRTVFGFSFDMFDLPRYCMTEDIWRVHDASSGVPHDVLLFMVNSSRYGGGAIYNHYTAYVSDNEYDDYLPVHEFGHGFAGLADEYYTSAVAYNDFYPRGVEPWEPNITALLDPEGLKWKSMVKEGIPIPTPGDDPTYDWVVGAFEGAGYSAKGLYRPCKDCKMFSKGNKEFCPVCRKAIVSMIRFYAPE